MRTHQSLHNYPGSLLQLLSHFFDFWRFMSICNWILFSLSMTMRADRVYMSSYDELSVLKNETFYNMQMMYFFIAPFILVWTKIYDENSRRHEMDRDDDSERHDNVESFDLSIHEFSFFISLVTFTYIVESTMLRLHIKQDVIIFDLFLTKNTLSSINILKSNIFNHISIDGRNRKIFANHMKYRLPWKLFITNMIIIESLIL